MNSQLIPATKDQEYQRPAPTLRRVRGHHEDWVRACKDGKSAGSNFDYGGPLTEVALLGVLAQRFPGQKLVWDAQSLTVTNFADANRYLDPPYRAGWKL